MNSKYFLTLLLFGLLGFLCHGQTISSLVMASNGGTSSNSNTSISFTTGEVCITTLTSSNVMLTQGFHQPINSTTSLEIEWLGPEIQIGPNPVNSSLWIDYTGYSTIEIQIIDLNGKVLTKTYISGKDQIDMVSYASGMYLIKIYAPSSNSFFTQKIIKQ